MRSLSPWVLAAALVASATSASALTTNLIRNGSFELNETGDLASPGQGLVNGLTWDQLPNTGSGWDVYDRITGWVSGDTDAGIEIQTNRTLSTIDARDGVRYVELDSDNDYRVASGRQRPPEAANNSSMTQTLALGRGFYKFSFAYSPRVGGPTFADSGIKFGIGSLLKGSIAQNLTFEAGFAPLSSSLAPAPAIGSWSTAQMIFQVVTAGSYDVTFKATGNANEHGGFIDSVHLSAVPLPAPALLLVGAIAGFAAFRRRTNA